jgi:hypothetical protein
MDNMFRKYDDANVIRDVLYIKLNEEIIDPLFSYASLRRRMSLCDLFRFENSCEFFLIYQACSEQQICQMMNL